jgi:hypothetical protein
MIWHELKLVGNSAYRFDSQIADLEPFLGDAWKAGVNPKTGNPVYERPVVLVIYRDDHKFLLDPLLPRPGGTMAGYDLVIASQPYRARSSLEFKTKRVIAPLARALGPGGRMIAIQSQGNDPDMKSFKRCGRATTRFCMTAIRFSKPLSRNLARRAAAQLQRLCRQPRAVPLRHAHAAVRG